MKVPNYQEFIAMLEAKGIPYKLFDLEYCVYVEVGSKGCKFAYRFNINGKWAGGWQLGDSSEIREQYIRVLHTGSPE